MKNKFIYYKEPSPETDIEPNTQIKKKSNIIRFDFDLWRNFLF